MKHLTCLLLTLFYFGCHAQQSTRWQGDSTFSAQLQSTDTTKVKVYNFDSVIRGDSGMWDIYTLHQPRIDIPMCWFDQDYFLYIYPNGHTIRFPRHPSQTYDTIHNPLHDFECKAPSIDVPKYDTIGPMWRLVSDTAAGHWNPASAMRVYELVNYVKLYPDCLSCPESESPRHHAWLDSNRKPLKLAVWNATIQ